MIKVKLDLIKKIALNDGDFDVKVIRETPASYLIEMARVNSIQTVEKWIPKSQINLHLEKKGKGIKIVPVDWLITNIETLIGY